MTHIFLLKSKDAAEALGITARTLENWRYLGKGPECIHIGKTVRYATKDIEAWIEEQKKAS